MDNKTKWLIGGFGYMLGAMGTFFVTFLDIRKATSSSVDAFEKAAVKAVIWPIELINLFF